MISHNNPLFENPGENATNLSGQSAEGRELAVTAELRNYTY